MVERYRRNQGRRKLLGNHQKCWIWGRNVVTETLDAGRWEIVELRLSESLPPAELAQLRDTAERRDIPLFVESHEALRKRCHSAEHQGLLAKMTEFPYAEAEAVLADRPVAPFYVILDGIQDPYNFGAIVRSAEVLGAVGVFIAREQQVGVTSLVARTSAGAVNHVPIARVDDLPALARRMLDLGQTLIAATEAAGTPLFDCDFRGPAAIVIGNEGRGIRDELLKLCTAHVSIPQTGRVGSLNAAVAASILFYEAARQRAT